jgi:hypothetical protein
MAAMDGDMATALQNLQFAEEQLNRATATWDEAKRLQPETPGAHRFLDAALKDMEFWQSEVKARREHWERLRRAGKAAKTLSG